MKKVLVAIGILAALAVILLSLRYYIYRQIEARFDQEIDALNKGDMTITYDSVVFDWRRRNITVTNLAITKKTEDSICSSKEKITARSALLHKLGLWTLVFRKKINAEKLELDSPSVTVFKQSSFFADSATSTKEDFSMVIDEIKLNGLRFRQMDAKACELLTEFTSDVAIEALELQRFPDGPLRWEINNINLLRPTVKLPHARYTLRANEVRAPLLRNIMAIDSLRIIPHDDKVAFGQAAGHDVDRLEGLFPYLHFSGLRINTLDTIAFQVTKMEIQLFVDIFHDKRLPHRNIRKPLWVESLQTFPFGLRIDSLAIKNSKIRYEEVAPNAQEAGAVFFENLDALLVNITNDRTTKNADFLIYAQTQFMGKGLLDFQTSMPYDAKKAATLKGSLSGFPLPSINHMLDASTRISIESGTINKLSFDLSYTDKSSNGSVNLNYEDLKLITFKEESKLSKSEKRKMARKGIDENEKVDNFKTFLLNAFVIRKNLDERVPAEERAGAISFERDQTRSIFHFWWKSVFTGVTAAANLDKGKK